LHQSGFAHPGLAADDDPGRLAGDRAAHSGLEDGELGAATHEHGAHEAGSHPFIFPSDPAFWLAERS
jgi:hypothetical protein